MSKKNKKNRKEKEENHDGSSRKESNGNGDEGLGIVKVQPEKSVGSDTAQKAANTNYPRYRVEPGERVRLSDVNPDESEEYKSEEEVAEELERLRLKLEELQMRYAHAIEQRKLCCMRCLHVWEPFIPNPLICPHCQQDWSALYTRRPYGSRQGHACTPVDKR